MHDAAAACVTPAHMHHAIDALLYSCSSGVCYLRTLVIVLITNSHNILMDHLSEEEIQEFREIFNLVDRDGGGSITGTS